MDSLISINKFKSRKEWGDYVWDKLMAGLLKANSLNNIKEALDLLLTANEKKQIINRASAISFLKQGKSYRDIGAILWLSPVTISAIKKSIHMERKYISSYERNKKSEKKQKPLTKKNWIN